MFGVVVHEPEEAKVALLLVKYGNLIDNILHLIGDFLRMTTKSMNDYY